MATSSQPSTPAAQTGQSPPINPLTATSQLATDTLLAAQALINAPTEPADPAAEDTATASEASEESPEAAAADEEGDDQSGEKTNAQGLTTAEQQQVQELKQRDAEVKRHEQAHAAVGGQYASAPTYEYQTGPDGRQYAIGGEVSINTSPLNDPEATIAKLTVVRRAALAPAEPSPQDQRVASEANQGIAQASAELRTEQQEESREARREEEDQRAENREDRPDPASAPTDPGDSSDPSGQSGSSQFGEGGISARQAADAFSQAAALTEFPSARDIDAERISRITAEAQAPAG